jgi:beta-N-acetylhexosaminidase
MNIFADFYFLTQMDGDGNFDGLSAMGFSALHNFEEVSCDAATWTMVPPS